jgi:hypothetical protein
MRAIRSVSKRQAGDVLKLVFAAASTPRLSRSAHHSSAIDTSQKVIIDIETSTPLAKKLTDDLMRSEVFDLDNCSVSTRQPRAVVSKERYADITRPWVEPAVDICQELWQFSHITAGFAGRVLIAGGLLAFGIINQQLLLMIAGMLFLPLLPILLGIGFGSWTGQWAW